MGKRSTVQIKATVFTVENIQPNPDGKTFVRVII